MSPVRTSLVTPGVSSAKSMKLRPLTGRFWTETSLTVELTCERPASMMGACALTSTLSATVASPISMRSVRVWPTVSRRSPCLRGVKPVSSAATSYTPTGSKGALKSPWSPLTVTRVVPVAGWVMFTVTPGRTAPD